MSNGLTLWHYTCADGHAALGEVGTLLPMAQHGDPDRLVSFPTWARPLLGLVWLTDRAAPDSGALGLTRWSVSCDRTAYRYRVTDLTGGIARYGRIRRSLPPMLAHYLETAPGAEPAGWFVTRHPVPVVLDRILT